MFDNPWSKHNSGASAFKDEHNSELVQDESTIFVGFDRACQFIEGQEGPVLDARSPEAYMEGHLPGAHHLFFYNMIEYYPQLEDRL